jgi:hypothetical protein
MSIAERLALRRGEIAAGRSKGLRPYKFRAGRTLFRILPQPGYPANIAPGTMGIERRFGQTFLKSFDGKNIGSIGDREITYGQADPVRDMLFQAMRAAPTDEVKKHYQEMLANPRIIFCAVILDDPNQSPNEPVLIEVSETAFDEGILAQAMVWADTGVDVFDPATGHIYQVERSGQAKETSYTWAVTPKQAPIGQAILDKVIDLDAWIQALFEGKEARCFEALAKLNASVGISVAPPQLTAGTPTPQALPAPATAAAPVAAPATAAAPVAAPVTAAAPAPVAPQPAMVTHAIDAEYEEVAPPAAAPAPVAAAPVAAAPVAAAPVAETPAPVAPQPAAAGEPDLDSILASLS